MTQMTLLRGEIISGAGLGTTKRVYDRNGSATHYQMQESTISQSF